MVGIVACLVLPFVEFTKTIYSEQPSFQAFGEELALHNTKQISPIEAPFDWWLVAYVVYGIGLIIFIVRFVLQLLSLRNVLKKHPASKQGKYLFIETTEEIPPFSFFKYIVFNPEQHLKEELAMILEHEKVHVSQWHSIDLIAANLVQAIQWINPIAWLYKMNLEENLEFIADQVTVAQVASKKQYQLTLVKNSSLLRTPALTSQFYQSFIKKRIVMLNKSTSSKRNMWKLCFVLPLLCIFLLGFSVKEEIHYLSSESSTGKVMESFTILPTTTDQELDLMEAYFEGDHVNARVRISNRRRDENGLINSFHFKTKFKGQSRFYSRFSIGGNAKVVFKGHTVRYNEGIITISEIGPKATKFTITKEMLKVVIPE